MFLGFGIILGTLVLCVVDCFVPTGDVAGILFQDGSVMVKRPGNEEWVPISDNEAIGAGYEILTDEEGTIELLLPGENYFKIGPKTHVVIREIGTVEVTRLTRNSVELVSGKVRALLSAFANKRSRFLIETENAHVGVRGTDFGLISDAEAGVTEILCLSGEIGVEPIGAPDSGEPVTIGADEGLTLVVGKPVGVPEKLDPEVRKRFETEMEFMSLRSEETVQPVPTEEGEAPPEQTGIFYTIEVGDTLSKLAQRHYGVSTAYPVIYDENNAIIDDPDLIYPGQVIRIPEQ
jgi:LysM repeat protein